MSSFGGGAQSKWLPAGPRRRGQGRPAALDVSPGLGRQAGSTWKGSLDRKSSSSSSSRRRGRLLLSRTSAAFRTSDFPVPHPSSPSTSFPAGSLKHSHLFQPVGNPPLAEEERSRTHSRSSSPGARPPTSRGHTRSLDLKPTGQAFPRLLQHTLEVGSSRWARIRTSALWAPSRDSHWLYYFLDPCISFYHWEK